MKTRVGMCYWEGPADKMFDQNDPAFRKYEVVSDESASPCHVTVRGPAGQEFPVPIVLIDTIARRP